MKDQTHHLKFVQKKVIQSAKKESSNELIEEIRGNKSEITNMQWFKESTEKNPKFSKPRESYRSDFH